VTRVIEEAEKKLAPEIMVYGVVDDVSAEPTGAGKAGDIAGMAEEQDML
jgi:hypothetical protein